MRKHLRFLILIMVIALLCISSTLFFSGNDEKKITDFVVANKAELENIALEYLNGDKKVRNYKGIEVDDVYLGNHPMVQFFYSGTGIVTSSKYRGFYFSKDDVPLPFQNGKNELVSVSNNEWKWEDGTDNGGLTKRITDCWFYYEAWF